MRAKDVIGRRIIGVRQQRAHNALTGTTVWDVTSLELDNGTVLILHALETEEEPVVTAEVLRIRTPEQR